MIILGVALTGPLWGRGVTPMITRVLIALGGCGYVLAALRPADVDLNLHLLGALFIMGAGNVGLILAGSAVRRGAFPGLRVPTLVLAALALVGTILHFGQVYAGLGMGGTERVAIFAVDAWLAMSAACLLRTPRLRHIA